jgi:23S rRNA (guanine745-N1)-methyltransferase
MKKMDVFMKLIDENPGLLACPLCGGELGAGASRALRCPAGHSFDPAASGYANLLAKAVRSDYDAALFESRNAAIRSGFFDDVIRETADIVSRFVRVAGSGPLVLLDAGCGEGSQLHRLSQRLKASAGNAAVGIGIDISRDAIRLAARDYPGFLWLVADLARMPLTDGRVDCIVNVLSPSNYGEFARALKDGGLLVKAVPGEDYLRELREALYPGGEKRLYSNARVAELFRERFEVVEQRRVTAAFPMSKGLWPHIVAMTPLAWGAGAERIEAVKRAAQASVTLDLLLLAGRKRGKGDSRMEAGS